MVMRPREPDRDEQGKQCLYSKDYCEQRCLLRQRSYHMSQPVPICPRRKWYGRPPAVAAGEAAKARIPAVELCEH